MLNIGPYRTGHGPFGRCTRLDYLHTVASRTAHWNWYIRTLIQTCSLIQHIFTSGKVLPSLHEPPSSFPRGRREYDLLTDPFPCSDIFWPLETIFVTLLFLSWLRGWICLWILFVAGNATYKSPCRSVGRSVRRSVGPSVRHTLFFFFFFFLHFWAF